MIFILEALYLDMIKITKDFLKEPLLHFLLLGALVYGYFLLVSAQQESAKKIVQISAYERQELQNMYEKSYAKKASKEILDVLIAQKYYDAVLLDKAFSLQLAKNDALVRERLLKKMQFLMQERSKFHEPSQEELHKYYEQHIQEYSHIKSISFSSIFFHNEKDKRIAQTMRILSNVKVESSLAKGFSEASKLPYHEENVSYEEVKRKYGKYFAKKLFMLRQGVWHKAIHAKDGMRIVYIDNKKVTQAYDFESVESRVYADYIQEENTQLKKQAYEKIASLYSLSVE